MAFVLMVGDAGVGGGGLGADEMGLLSCGFASVGSASASEAAASSSHDPARAVEFVKILGACASGEMASLSSEDCSAAADVDMFATLCCDETDGRVGSSKYDTGGMWY